MDDAFYMQLALDLAQKGAGFTSPNPMVGAVVVKDGAVVGKGYHRKVGGAHAEVIAIQSAGDFAQGATLYVNLEPCNHFGRTPACTEMIVQAGVKRVVAAMRDPNPEVAGGGADYLKTKGVECIVGICEAEARRLNEAFLKYMQTKHPFVILKCALTLDGRTATRSGDSKWISGEKARLFVHEMRHAADAIMVGVNTIKADDPRLTTRIDDMKGTDPIRLILDTHLSISESAGILGLESDADTVVITGSNYADAEKQAKIERLQSRGIKFLEFAIEDGRIPMQPLMHRLGSMGITSLLIEGGSQVAGSALRAGVIDKVVFFLAPKILGGDDGLPVISGPGPEFMNQAMLVRDIKIRRFGDDTMIEGYLS